MSGYQGSFQLLFSEVELVLKQGVYLYLGFSKKDEELLKKVTGQGALDAIGAIQGLVSYHNVNSNKVRDMPLIFDSSNRGICDTLVQLC